MELKEYQKKTLEQVKRYLDALAEFRDTKDKVLGMVPDFLFDFPPQAAKELAEQRDTWLNPPDMSESYLKKRTLTHLYNQRPEWLALAHKKLDDAVLDAYGWKHDLSDEEILVRLLELNLARAKAETKKKQNRS